MPIANCLCKKDNITKEKSENIVSEWAEIAEVDIKDICLNFIHNYSQFGQQYSVLANLYLPSLWSEDGIKKVQLGLLQTLAKHLELREDEIFIMTSIINSSHVIENGNVVEW